MRAQCVEDILHFPEVIARGRKSVDGEHLVARFQALGLGVAARLYPDDEAAVPDHLHVPAVIVVGSARRRNEVRVGIVERIESGSDFRERAAIGIDLVNLRVELLEGGVPVGAVECGIVIVLAHVGAHLIEHHLGTLAIELGKLWLLRVGRGKQNDKTDDIARRTTEHEAPNACGSPEAAGQIRGGIVHRDASAISDLLVAAGCLDVTSVLGQQSAEHQHWLGTLRASPG